MTAPIVEDHPADGSRTLVLRLVRSLTSDTSALPAVVVSVYAVESPVQPSKYLVRGFGRLTGASVSDRDLDAVLYEQGLAALSLEEAQRVASELYAELARRVGVAS